MSMFVKCDTCEKKYPEGYATWYTLRKEDARGTFSSNRVNADLCSWECVVAYAQEQVSQMQRWMGTSR